MGRGVGWVLQLFATLSRLFACPSHAHVRMEQEETLDDIEHLDPVLSFPGAKRNIHSYLTD